MKEIQTDGIYAFADGEGTFVLDIANSRPLRAEGGLEDIAALEKLRDRPVERPRHAPLDYMRAQLCVTHSCNLRCLYCELDGENPRRGGNMDLVTAKRAIHTILSRKPAHVKKIVISLTSNGEPLVNFDMVDSLISYCDGVAADEGCSFSFAFATNGTLLTEPILDRILKHENLKIFFSIDGSRSEHDTLRPYAHGGPSYGDLLSAIRLYVDKTGGLASRQLGASTVITTHNLDVPAIYRELIGAGFGDILTRPVRGRPGWDFALNAETLEKYKNAYTDFYHFLNETIDRGETIYLESMTPVYDFFSKPACIMILNEKRLYTCYHCPPAGTGAVLGDYSLTYDADGSVICPCRDVIGIEQFKAGSLDGEIDEEAVARISALTCEGKPECSTCWARYICGGGCFFQSYHATGDIAKADVVMCEMTRHVTRLAMKFLLHLEEAHPPLYAAMKTRTMKRLPWRCVYGV